MTKEERLGVIERIKRSIFDKKVDKAFCVPVTHEAVRRAKQIDPRKGLYAAWTDKGLVPKLHDASKRRLYLYRSKELYQAIDTYCIAYLVDEKQSHHLIDRVVDVWKSSNRETKHHVHQSLPIVGIMLNRLTHEKEAK